MTITLLPAPKLASNDKLAHLASMLCECGGYLAITFPDEVMTIVHVDTCADCVESTPAARTTCAHRDLHRTCTTPTSRVCAHAYCGNDLAVGVDVECVDRLDNCCTCCETD